MRAALLALAISTGALGCAPGRSSRPSSPEGLEFEAVQFQSSSGATIGGWMSRCRPRGGAVLLLHGVGASRLDMLERGRFLRSDGYCVLLIDFRAHGESTGERTTYGGLESRDARAALEVLRSVAPGERIGVIGVSMGGAAALLGSAPLPVDALVLESVYPTIDDAVRDRLKTWLGAAGRLLAPVVVHLLFPRDGITARDLRPIDYIDRQTAPVFVLAGTEDRYTTLRESRRLYERAHAPKEFWAVPRAAHVDLHAFAPVEYERRVGAFLARHLRGDAAGAGEEPMAARAR